VDRLPAVDLDMQRVVPPRGTEHLEPDRHPASNEPAAPPVKTTRRGTPIGDWQIAD
jgi:hypothetical protein